MTMNIGAQIRELRRERRMTQEQLAEQIGISFQAVSKWENGIALPDITLVPRLAQIFGVTTDRLLCHDAAAVQRDIEDCVRRAAALRESDPAGGRRILEEGLSRYPDDDVLLNNLLYVIDYSRDPDETIRIASRLTDHTLMDDVRYDALRFLAYAYHAKGDDAAAVAALEQIPELYFTKLSEMAFILDGPAKRAAADKQKWLSFESMLQMMQKLAECCEAEGRIADALAETRRARALLRVMFDGDDDRLSGFAVYAAFFDRHAARLEALL